MSGVNLPHRLPQRLSQRLAAEVLGTALLLAVVVGSGIMGERLSGGNVAIALLANAIATGAALYALITTFAPISGAHFNPLVTMIEVAERRMKPHEALLYSGCQVVGAIAGVWAAHAMFELPILQFSEHIRTGYSHWFSECIATFGLVMLILVCSKSRLSATPSVVATYITAAYWFTASTSFANPAVTLARSLTDTFSGIRPVDVAGFVVAQIVGAFFAYFASAWLLRKVEPLTK